jgi:hypothetical protein
LAVTIDPDTGTHSLFIDAELVAQNGGARYTPSDLGETSQNWLGRSQYEAHPYFNGSLDDLMIYDRVLSQGEIQAIMAGVGDPFASGPDPADGAMHTDTWVILSWSSGDSAVWHDVYFGTNYDAVANATMADMTGIYRGRQHHVVYIPSEALEWAQTYYWRVDEIGPGGAIYTGTIWGFTLTPEEGWVPFITGAEPGAVHEAKLKSSDNTGILVDTDIPGMYSTNFCTEEDVCQRLSMPGAGSATEIGKPEVPIIRRYFEVPYDVNLTVEVVYSHAITLEEYNVCPVQPPRHDLITEETPEFVIDSNTYSTNAFYPAQNASVDEPALVRGHRIAVLTLCPVQYNPVTKQLRVYSKIEGRLNYDRPAQIEGVERRLESEAFESLCEAFIVNYKPPEEYPTRRYKDVGSPSVDYLIITHDDFETEVQPLADWKQKKGLRTKIVKTSDISAPADPTAAEITDYIKDAYDTWNPPPTYVLLVGDSEFIPTHYKNEHYSSRHGGHRTATDLYYGTLDGKDRYPDVFVGRISVDTTSEATTVVDKILGYEQSPPTNPNFYNDISACAYFEDDNDDGTAEKAYAFTTEQIRDHLDDLGYNVERIYATNSTGPANYMNGTAVAGGIAWNGTSADITAAFNSGRLIITHRDHGLSQNYWDYVDKWQGWYDGWSEPWFTTGDVAGLNNGNALPVVFSINCQTGWFDGETDPNTGWNFECYCEELLRHQNGGAVAAFGATRNSPTWCNDDLLMGFIDAIWPDFLSPTQNALYRLGEVLTYGKIAVVLEHGYSADTTKVEVEEYNLHGDPEMSIWTSQPQPLTVTHPPAIGSGGSQKFVVKVMDGSDPVLHALVCLRKDADVYMSEYTNPGGYVIFNITPSTGGDLDITVTKHNYLPYEGVITVTDGGAVITEFLPDSAVPGQPFGITAQGFSDGETVNIWFDAAVLDPTDATGGEIENVYRGVPSSHPEGPANVIVIGKSSGRAAVAVLTVLPPEPLPQPYIYSQWSSTTWHLNPRRRNPVWDNPCIQLYKESTGKRVSSGKLRIGTTYAIKAEFHNSAMEAAKGAVVTFRHSPFGIGQPWNLIGTDTVDVPPATGTVRASVNWTPILTGHCCIEVEIWHPLDSYLGNNRGQENCDVRAVKSPAEVTFDVYNPTDTPALVCLEAVQSDPCELGELWGTRIEREYPQVLEPGGRQTATLKVEAPDNARTGESRTISVTGKIDGAVVGGVDIQVIKDHPPVLADGYVDPDSGAGGTTDFTYYVKYTDQDGHPPMEGHPTLAVFKGGVPVSGSPFAMDEQDPNDTEYTDGKTYACSTTLPESGSDYTYCFWATDSLEVGAEGPSTDLTSGPLVAPCFPSDHSDYGEWVEVGEPACWCYPRQCHGDADGASGGSTKSGIYYVGPADLNLLVSSWLVKEPPNGAGITSVPDGICADFAHDMGGSTKSGLYRVGPTDLNILISNWLNKEPPHGLGIEPDCLDCP